jgi:hypothetical protein
MSAIVALFLATSPAPEKIVRTPVCSLRGTHTTLAVVRLSYPDDPRRATRDQLTIRSLGGVDVSSMTLDNASWTCLGFDAGTHRTLAVTYGKDTARARAKSRTTKRFALWPWPRVRHNPTSTFHGPAAGDAGIP